MHMREMRLYASLLLLFIFLLTSCSKRAPDTVVVVGDMSGKNKALGLSIQFGAKFADEHVQRISGRKRLQLAVEDDHGSPEEAKKIAFKLASNPKVLAVIGHSTSGTTAPAQEMYGKYSVPLLMPVATNPDITTDSANSGWYNTFRLVPTDDLQAGRIAAFARRELKARKAIVLHDQTRYGTTVGRALTRVFGEEQIEVPVTLKVESFIPGVVVYTDLIRKVADLLPDVVLFAGYYQECAALVKQFRATGNLLPMILSDGCFQTEFLASIGPHAGPLYVAFVAPDWARVPRAAALLADFQRYIPGADPSYAPFAADALMLVDEAVKVLQAQNQPITRKTLIGILHSNTVSFTGIAGPYSFDGAGDNKNGRNYIFRIVQERDSYRFRQLD